MNLIKRTPLAFIAILLCLSAAAQINGTAQLTVTSTATTALLAGVVVTSDNVNGALSTITGGVPAGWTLVYARGFESGMSGFENNTVPPGNNATITTAQAHTGGHSMGGSYFTNGSVVGWGIDPGHVGTFGTNWTELEISFWDWVSPQGLYGNSDYWLFGIGANGCNGNSFQDINMDAQLFGAPAGTKSIAHTGFFVVSQGDAFNGACQGNYQYNHSAGLNINAGTWRQYEFHIKPSTTVSNTSCTSTGNGSDCVGNGEFEMWINGAAIPGATILNGDLNGTASMQNPFVYVGGVITVCDDTGSCGTGACQPFTACPGPAPGTGAPPTYQRYIDDVIILER